MAEGQFKEGIAGGRLAPSQYADNFSDLHPPLDNHEALVEADRCYFCYDAPCMNACPTSIDIPLFPGYVFLRGDAHDRLDALATNLVAHVLPVDDQDQLHNCLSRIHRLLATGAPVTPEDRLEPGDPVEIIRGPLAGLEGKVLKRGKHLKFIIEVQFLRRAVSAEVEHWMIQPLAA